MPVENDLDPLTPITLVIGAEFNGKRLDKGLAQLLPNHTRASIQRWFKLGRVLVDGVVPAKLNTPLREGQRLDIAPQAGEPSNAEPDPSIVFDVLYEDSDLLVVNKPPGLVVHPGKGNWTGTLVNGLLARPGFERPTIDERDPEGQLRPGIVHRIDKDTSGLLVVAKTDLAREGLKKQFAAHSIERGYLAICRGVPRGGRVETFHGRNPVNRIAYSSRVEEGKLAITTIIPMATAKSLASLVRCVLETGRTHQIRVHLAEQFEAPILADLLYGGRDPQPLTPIGDALGRHALHAEILGFIHPRTGEKLHFSVPMPEDMEQAWQSLLQLQDAPKRR